MSESTKSVWRDEGPTMFSIDEVINSDVSSKIRKNIRELKAEKALRYRISNILVCKIHRYTIFIFFLFKI